MGSCHNTCHLCISGVTTVNLETILVLLYALRIPTMLKIAYNIHSQAPCYVIYTLSKHYSSQNLMSKFSLQAHCHIYFKKINVDILDYISLQAFEKYGCRLTIIYFSVTSSIDCHNYPPCRFKQVIFQKSCRSHRILRLSQIK